MVNVVRGIYFNPYPLEGMTVKQAIDHLAYTDFGDFRASVASGSFIVTVNATVAQDDCCLKNGDRLDILDKDYS